MTIKIRGNKFSSDLLKAGSVLFAFSFSFGIAINSIAFVLFIITSIIYFVDDYRKSLNSANFSEANIILVVFFFLIFIREIIIVPNETLRIVEAYIAFLILPIVIFINSKKLASFLPVILKGFVIGCFINVMINLGYACYRGLILTKGGINVWYFTYDLFSEPFGIQPIYLALFYVFSLFILILNNKIFGKGYYYTFFFFLTLGVFLLAARNAIVCLLVISPILLFLKKRPSLKTTISIIAIFGTCLFFALQNPVVKNRILKFNNKGNLYSGTQLRANIWDSALKVSKENLIFGSGEKYAGKLLLNEYKNRKLEVPALNNYHSHNQYLQSLVQYGLLGLFTLILIYSVSWYKMFNNKNLLAVSWITLFVLTSITESVFARQWGVFSFAFFTSLFYLNVIKEKSYEVGHTGN